MPMCFPSPFAMVLKNLVLLLFVFMFLKVGCAYVYNEILVGRLRYDHVVSE